MFHKVTIPQLAQFNSDASCDLISLYTSTNIENIRTDCARPRPQTFAPSAMRCKRKSWFRLRGAKPDILPEPDPKMQFTAMLGTAIHRHVQATLKQALGDDWIEVADYLRMFPVSYEYTLKQSDFETVVSISDPPITFACDGIIKLRNKYYLLEIKSSEYESFCKLTDTKPHHKPQICTYGAWLNIPNTLSLYVDRLYGDVKSFEYTLSASEMSAVKQDMYYVQQMAEACIAPERLPAGDYMCSNCEYKLKCKEW